jgi:hypothetical protein
MVTFHITRSLLSIYICRDNQYASSRQAPGEGCLPPVVSNTFIADRSLPRKLTLLIAGLQRPVATVIIPVVLYA